MKHRSHFGLFFFFFPFVICQNILRHFWAFNQHHKKFSSFLMGRTSRAPQSPQSIHTPKTKHSILRRNPTWIFLFFLYDCNFLLFTSCYITSMFLFLTPCLYFDCGLLRILGSRTVLFRFGNHEYHQAHRWERRKGGERKSPIIIQFAQVSFRDSVASQVSITLHNLKRT